MFRRITVLAAGVIAAAGLAMAAAPAAHATTGTCTNIATPISAPIGCGGVFLPLLGSGIQPNASSLTLTAPSDVWNAPVTLTPYSASDSTQDLTVYQACAFTAGNAPVAPTEAFPCGINGTPVIDPVSGFGEYVAEITPGGNHIGGTINSLSNLCLSVEAVADGPLNVFRHHAIRWHAVLRTCDTYGAHFTAGTPDPPSGHGIPGVVNLANHFQTWSPIPAAGGYVLANNALSGNAFNHPYVLDARGGHGPSVIAFPENDQANQTWKVIGCTQPVTGLTPGFFACP